MSPMSLRKVHGERAWRLHSYTLGLTVLILLFTTAAEERPSMAAATYPWQWAAVCSRVVAGSHFETQYSQSQDHVCTYIPVLFSAMSWNTTSDEFVPRLCWIIIFQNRREDDWERMRLSFANTLPFLSTSYKSIVLILVDTLLSPSRLRRFP